MDDVRRFLYPNIKASLWAYPHLLKGRYITFLFLCNPNGYPCENSDVDFDANFVLEL